MKIKEADRLLSEAFPGKYRVVAYELATHPDGTIQTSCSGYVEGGKWITFPTFQSLLDEMIPNTEEPQEIEA